MKTFTVSQLSLLALAAGSALVQAHQMKAYKGPGSVLQKRQEESTGSQAFTPEIESKDADSCVEAFGAGYLDCTLEPEWICYNPEIGQSCCGADAGAATHMCPEESFCLPQGQCCPNGLSAETCARDLGISLPADFSATSAAPVGTGAAVHSSAQHYNTSSAVVVKPTASATYPYSRTSVAVFTGGAAINAQGVPAGITGLVVGLLGLIGGLL